MNKEVEVVRINVPKFGDILTARPEDELREVSCRASLSEQAFEGAT